MNTARYSIVVSIRMIQENFSALKTLPLSTSDEMVKYGTEKGRCFYIPTGILMYTFTKNITFL